MLTRIDTTVLMSAAKVVKCSFPAPEASFLSLVRVNGQYSYQASFSLVFSSGPKEGGGDVKYAIDEVIMTSEVVK